MTPRRFSPARLGAALLLLAALSTAVADSPRALSPGQLPDDVRLGPLKDLNGYFPFVPATSPDEWNRRAERVRQRMLVALGLWPMPTKTPLHPVVHGRVDREDYTVDRVYFESVPGFFVTGSLFRPKSGGRHPAVLNPHGHWADGRFFDAGSAGVQAEIAAGGEQFAEGGRSLLQALCVELARLGCVVFLYDTLGNADSVQIPESVAHGFAKQRPEMNGVRKWGLFSPQAEAHCQNVMGLQTWNSIRALDFLTSLPDVDPRRVAVTGASGGGTQTFMLCALDPRPAVAFPAVMVSTAMQGGCTCENACDLRIDTGNVEFAALFAPKPLGMTAANDWTREMPAKGFPELQRHFAMLGAPQNVMLAPFLQFGHNYNAVSRGAMYGWLNRHLQLGAAEPIVERDYRRLGRAELTVWDDRHPAPAGGPEFERQLLHWLDDDARKSLAVAARSPANFRRVYGGGLEIVLGRTLGEVGEVDWRPTSRRELGSYSEEIGLARNRSHDEALPAVILRPASATRPPALWVDVKGKAGLYAADGALGPEIQALLAAGTPVVGVDLLSQGEFLPDGQPVTRTRRVNDAREAAAFTFGYNDSLFAQRVHDLLTMVKLAGREFGGQPVSLVGLAGAGPWVAAACAVGGDGVNAVAVDSQGFRFGEVLDLWAPNFLPGGAKYGDLPGMLALHAPRPLWLAGEAPAGLEFVRRQYPGAAARQLAEYHGEAAEESRAAVNWLLAVTGPQHRQPPPR